MKTRLVLFACCFFHFSEIYSQDVEFRSIIETCAQSMNEFWADNDIDRHITYSDSSRIIGFDEGSEKYVLRDIDHDAVWTIQFTEDSRDSLYLTFDNEGTWRHVFRLINEDDSWTVVEHLMTIAKDKPDSRDAERFQELLDSHESEKARGNKKN
ncbi:hypothetical protein O3Q51_08280 [Cryomorphaceae bacterium 1068]|nr:hypothetical protein [Cryomorphaceae bacterium 1068]